MVLKTRVNMAMMTAYEAKAKPPNAKLPRAHFSDHNVYKSSCQSSNTQKKINNKTNCKAVYLLNQHISAACAEQFSLNKM